jgi:hypothetical protein
MKCGKLAAQIGCRLRGLVPSGLEIALTVRNRAQRYRMSRPHLERVHSIYIAVTADSDLTVRYTFEHRSKKSSLVSPHDFECLP